MSDLDAFRSETRDWLQANCPESMRTPGRSFEELYQGGRNPDPGNPDQ